MLLLDVNVVLALHRADHPHHDAVLAWFETVRTSGADFTVPTTVWASFLRLATHRRVFEVPTPREEAFAFVAAVLAQPAHLPTGPGPRHLELLRRACAEADASGDLVPDAVLVAVAAEHGCTVASLDRDLARFSSAPTVNPLSIPR